MSREIAILMAAGLGTRMRPITDTIPKPLVRVKQTPMIETVIQGLKTRGIDEIHVVTGYLADQFTYLTDKYPGLSITVNHDYRTINNISSIKAVTDVLRRRDAFICEADLYIPDPDVFVTDLSGSCYFGKFVSGYCDDWCFTEDVTGRIVRVGIGGNNCYSMCGISYFREKDSTTIADAIDKRYKTPGYEDLFWDNVVNENLDKLELTVHPISPDMVTEIDSVEELCRIDSSYNLGK